MEDSQVLAFQATKRADFLYLGLPSRRVGRGEGVTRSHAHARNPGFTNSYEESRLNYKRFYMLETARSVFKTRLFASMLYRRHCGSQAQLLLPQRFAGTSTSS